jgi:hypothetical protein
MRWVAVCVAGAAILVGAAFGIGLVVFSSHAPQPTAAPAKATAALARATAAPPKSSPRVVTSSGRSTFASPTGNITCAMAAWGATCDVTRMSWSLTSSDLASCGETALAGMSLSADGTVGFDCRTDVLVPDPQRVLAYGQSLAVGPLTCSSASTGTTCRDRRNGHGFFVSREGYRRH